MPRRIRLLKRAPLSALNKAVLPLPPAPTPLFSFVNFFHPFAPLSILTFFQFVEAHGLQINRWVRTISERSWLDVYKVAWRSPTLSWLRLKRRWGGLFAAPSPTLPPLR